MNIVTNVYTFCSQFTFETHRWCNVSKLTSNVVDRGFEPWAGKTKDNKIGICCFSTMHAALRRKSKDWFARNQDNVFEWGDMSIHGAITIKIQLSVLVYYKADLVIISLKINLFSSWYSRKIAELPLNNNPKLPFVDVDLFSIFVSFDL